MPLDTHDHLNIVKEQSRPHTINGTPDGSDQSVCCCVKWYPEAKVTQVKTAMYLYDHNIIRFTCQFFLMLWLICVCFQASFENNLKKKHQYIKSNNTVC